MLDLFLKIVFFIFLLPYLIVENGIEKLNARREKQGKKKIKIDVLHVLVVALAILLVIMWINGFR